MPKLVRDLIPDIMIRNGQTPITHIADEKEYNERLSDKLIEEVIEYICLPIDKSLEELADVMEVIKAILKTKKISDEYFEKICQEKRCLLNQKTLSDPNEFLKIAMNYKKNESIEELAMLAEIIQGLLKIKNIAKIDFEKIRLDKRKERGSFNNKIILMNNR